MLKKCKYSGVYPYTEIPKSFLDYYKVCDNDERVFIANQLRADNVIFIYSAFINDLLKSKKISLFKLLKPGRIKCELKTRNIGETLVDMERNLEHLTEINPRIQIYLIGIFVPTKLPYTRKNVRDFIQEVNKCFKEIAKKYPNVHLVDNMNLSSQDFNNIDFHPNESGHEKIYQNLLQRYKRQRITKV